MPNGKPKTLWIKALRPGAEETRRGLALPPECTGGADGDGWGVLPLSAGQAETLHEALCHTPAPRQANRQFHIGALLAILAMAVMAGTRTFAQVVRFAETLTLKQRKALGLPRYKPGSDYRKTPSYSAFYNLLRQIDAEAFTRVMTGWLQRHEGTLPRQLALDGKFIGDVVGIVSLVNTETGSPVAVAPASQKEGEGGRARCGPAGACWRRPTWPAPSSPPMRCTNNSRAPARRPCPGARASSRSRGTRRPSWPRPGAAPPNPPPFCRDAG